jgi:hypothetical protein
MEMQSIKYSLNKQAVPEYLRCCKSHAGMTFQQVFASKYCSIVLIPPHSYSPPRKNSSGNITDPTQTANNSLRTWREVVLPLSQVPGLGAATSTLSTVPGTTFLLDPFPWSFGVNHHSFFYLPLSTCSTRSPPRPHVSTPILWPDHAHLAPLFD